MGDVMKRGNRFGICIAPSESDTGSGPAKVFGEFAEGLIVANYAKNMKGTIPATIWTDRVPGPPLPSNPAFFVPPQILSMFAWLAARNPGLMARAGEFAQFCQDIGFASAVPDIIDNGSHEWYEIKPGSPSGVTAGLAKLANIPRWMAKFGLPYIPGITYTPGKNDDIDLLDKLPTGFRNFIQMMASRIGGIEDLKITLSFRRTMPGLVLYWICVTMRIRDREADADEVADLVRNVVRWTTVHTIRAANGTIGDPNKPIEVVVDCKDATIRDCFVPNQRGLVSAVLRAPPAPGYHVLGGTLATQMLRRSDQMRAWAENPFRVLPATASGPMFSRSDAQILVIGGLIIVAIAIAVVTVEVWAPILLATAPEASAVASEAGPAIAALEQQGALLAQTEAIVQEGAMERMLAEQQLRVAFRLLSRAAASKTVQMASSAPAAMYVLGAGNSAQAATVPARTGSGGGTTPAQRALSQVETVRLDPWLDLHLTNEQAATLEKAAPYQPRQQVGGSIFLYSVSVADFPELHVSLWNGPSDQLL